MSATSTPNTIKLRGDSLDREAKAAAAITPGHLVEITSTGTVQKHATASGAAPSKAFALENEIVGKGIGDAYAANDRVLYGVFQPGAQVYAWLVAGTGGDVVIGSPLVSSGDGTLKTVTVADATLEGAVVARSLEAIDNDPGTGSAAVRLRVEIL